MNVVKFNPLSDNIKLCIDTVAGQSIESVLKMQYLNLSCEGLRTFIIPATGLLEFILRVCIIVYPVILQTLDL